MTILHRCWFSCHCCICHYTAAVIASSFRVRYPAWLNMRCWTPFILSFLSHPFSVRRSQVTCRPLLRLRPLSPPFEAIIPPLPTAIFPPRRCTIGQEGCIGSINRIGYKPNCRLRRWCLPGAAAHRATLFGRTGKPQDGPPSLLESLSYRNVGSDGNGWDGRDYDTAIEADNAL